jgi:hypothetical protein
MNEFEEQFGGLLTGTLEMFQFSETKEESMAETDIDRIYFAEEKVKEIRKRGKEIVDAARDDLRGTFDHVSPWSYRP